MCPRPWIASMLATLSLVGCSHDQAGQMPPPRGAYGTSPLAPFDDVNIPHPNSREQLAAALRERGFLAANAGPETQLGGAIRAFQRSEGIPQTGFPDDETLRRLGIDPATKDRTLDPSEVQMGAGSAAGVTH
jgi:peptidoglycan hydrolase-like protein with peptidoglycan-binding domain